MYQVMPLVVVIAGLTVVRPYSRVIWRQAWREGIQCLLCEGKRRKRILCPWIWRTGRNCSPGLGWGQAQRWRNVSEPCEDGQHVHFYRGAFKQSHVGTTKKKKKNCLQPVPKTNVVSSLMLHAFFFCKEKSNQRKQGWPLLTSFCFFDKLSKTIYSFKI